MRIPCVVVCSLAALILMALPAQAAREYAGRHTREKLANARANVQKHDWAKKIRDDAVRAAEPWVQIDDDTLWSMVPGQDLPRCINVTLDRSGKGPAKRVGCLKCGEKLFAFGNYPYNPDFTGKPWKLTCPSCSAVFPTNDFGKYYQSGINEHGLFDPKKADRSLLFNTEHPDPRDPLHKFGVDDGYGFIDENGHPHRFIGYYTWKYWRNLFSGLTALSNAYVYTGEQQYAHKAAILLDRIADVYPSMDWKPYASKGWFHSDGGRLAGKIEGAIWETQTAGNLAESYDKIISGTRDDQALFAFLKQKAGQYKLNPKGTRDLFVENVDRNILHCIHDGILDEQISGNEGMQQRAMALAAMALNTEPVTSQWLDWLFLPDGGAIPGLMMNHIDRDGASDEAAPGYAYFWGQLVGEIGVLLDNYPAYTRHNIFRDFVQFRNTFTIALRMCAFGYATPNAGDSGATGLIEAQSLRPDFIAMGFSKTGDESLAIAAYRANGNKADGLGRDIFSTDPEEISRKIDTIAKERQLPRGQPEIERYTSDLLTGFGMAMLQSGLRQNGAAVAMSFGRTAKHSHLDHLNFDLLAFGNWLLPDHGYPEYATDWPSRNEWTMNTLSHNTVVVDQQPQQRIWTGHTRLFKSLPGFSVVTIDGRNAYPQTKRYERTLMLVDAPNGGHYVVDIFRIEGGSDHVYSIHGPPGELTTENLNLTTQNGGTYAGENVQPEAPSGKDFPLGYSYLFNVRRDRKPPSAFSIDWRAQDGYRAVKPGDNVHIRYHAMTATEDVALADGKPPQTKAGNPKSLPYALLHRSGRNLASNFVSVIEPYRDRPVIKTASRDGDEKRIELRVELADGTVDVIAFEDGRDCPKVEFVRRATKETTGILIGGTLLDSGALRVQSTPAITGRVVKMNRGLEGGGWIEVDADLPADGSLIGEHIMINTEADRNACYRIAGVQKREKGSRIDCGAISFVRGYLGETITIRSQVVPKSYDAGFAYDFEEGAAFRIPMHAILKAASTD